MNKNVLMNEYVLKDRNIKKEDTIVNISDVHSNIEALKHIKKILEDIKAKYVFMPGDIVDSINNPYNEEVQKILKKISKLTDIYISLGNHELVKNLDNSKKVNASEYKEFFESLAKDSNVTPLIDEFDLFDLDDNMIVNAINPPLSYYEHKEKINIPKKIMEENLDGIDTDRLNILLSHSPNACINDGHIDKSMQDMNLILSGHNHGGLVPPKLQDLFKNSHTGFVGPYSNFFRKSAYGIYNDNNSSVLISNGVTKISETSKLGKISEPLNKIYVPEIDIIKLEPSDEHILNLTKRKIHKI